MLCGLAKMIPKQGQGQSPNRLLSALPSPGAQLKTSSSPRGDRAHQKAAQRWSSWHSLVGVLGLLDHISPAWWLLPSLGSADLSFAFLTVFPREIRAFLQGPNIPPGAMG